MSGKNSADIRLVVDAIDLAYSKDHIDTFVIVSGDSDFSPLVSKLKELGKHVIGLGLSEATSDLLRDNCDEFIYYEDLDRAPIIPVAVNDSIPEKKRKVFALLLDSLLALRRENKEIIYSSMLKDTIKRKKPSFNEGYYGYRTFSELLEDAQREGILELEKHKSSGMYVVARFGLELQSGGPSQQPPPRVVQLPPRNNSGEQKKVVELPKPVTQAEKRILAGLPPASKPPVGEASPPDDRLLGRALVEEIDSLDEEPLEEAPSYGSRRTESKPAGGRPAKPAAKGKEPTKPTAKEAGKPAASRGSRPAKPPARPAKPQSEKPPARKPEPEPKPLPPTSDEDEFGAGLDVE